MFEWSQVMKSKILIYTCILSALSFSAFSQESKFCANPLKSICIDTKKQIDIRKTRIENLKKEIATEAEKNAEPKIKRLEKPNNDDAQITEYEFRKKLILDQETIKVAISKAKNVESVISNQKNILLFKKYMKLAIDDTNFSESIRLSLKNTIDEVMIGSYGDYIDRARSKDHPEDGFSNSCGADGMTLSAFASDLKGQKYVLICPGYLITLNEMPTEQEKFNSIIQVISHELGHHLYDDFIKLNIYNPYLSCLVENYADQFRMSSLSKNIKYYSQELISDQWGLKALTIFLKKQNFKKTNVETIFKMNFANICGSPDDEYHPSGDFRIETLLRINPEVSSYLSCNNSRFKKPSCTFDGAVNL